VPPPSRSLTTAASHGLLSPEGQLLVLTTAVRPAAAAVRRLLSIGINWQRLCDLAQCEKAEPIVLRELWRLWSAEPPPATAGRLRQLATVSAIQMLPL